MIPVALGLREDRLSTRVCKLLDKRRKQASQYRREHIDARWKSFRATNAGKEVAQVLAKLFNFKCAYCEQEAARDVEHFFPKSRYPKRMYLWTNFLWGCKNCNTEKLDAFPVDAEGNAVLLNPTLDEPLDYLGWDELSGKIVPHPDPIRGQRATETRDKLMLDHFSLAEERRNKLANVRYLLARVVGETPVEPDTVERLREELATHRPWLGIIRQFFRRPSPEATRLIDAASAKLPELADWTAIWL